MYVCMSVLRDMYVCMNICMYVICVYVCIYYVYVRACVRACARALFHGRVLVYALNTSGDTHSFL